jgi:hypothetical protein
MTTLRFEQKTTLTPAQFIAGLTDFGPGRSKVFRYSTDGYLKVHRLDATEADVTEGSASAWERLHYDWSNPERVVLTTVDSNVWGGASGFTYTFTPSPDGSTTVNAVIVREGKNFKGRVLALVVGTLARGMTRKSFVNSVKAIEGRDDQAKEP